MSTLPVLQSFLNTATPSLKICGLTTADDSRRLADLKVDALGANFWPKSKRFLDPEHAGFLADLAGQILRVGVFVNAGPDQPRALFRQGLIDVVQLHGDESPEESKGFLDDHIPVIKALGIRDGEDLDRALQFPAHALLLDAHAPGVYGGTGRTFDWNLAAEFIAGHPEKPVLLAGGIVPENVDEALKLVRPAAIDIASGAESSPGIKDFNKVQALLSSVRSC